MVGVILRISLHERTLCPLMTFQVTYYSSCVGDGPIRQTNKCSGLRVGSRVQFTAKIEVVKCPKDPREWKQTFQIKPVGIDEAVIVNLEMMCQCDCEKPGNPVS